MKINLFLVISLTFIFFSCNKQKENKDAKISGLVVYISGDLDDNCPVQLTINGIEVFNGAMVYGKIPEIPDLMKIQTNIRDSAGYFFEMRFCDREKSFYIPAVGLDSIIIASFCYIKIEEYDLRGENLDKDFTFYITKNITDQCNLKIAIDGDTLYDGKFINNYPIHKYNTMKFIPEINKKGNLKFYVEVENEFVKRYIEFERSVEKYKSVHLDMKCDFNVTTNLDDNWEECWMID